jgi:hypothetical protein
MNRTTSTASALVACFGALASLQAHAAAPAPGDIIVAGGNTVVSIDPRTGNQTLVSDDEKSLAAGGQALFSGGDIYGGVGRLKDGDLVVIERRGNYDAPNPDPARLIRIDPATGAQSLIQGSDPNMTYSQLALAVAPSGDIYFSAESNTPGTAIYKANPDTGAISLVTNAAKSVAAGGANIPDSPMGLWVDPDGTLWMLAEFTGVVRIDPATGKMTLFSSAATSGARGGGALFGDPRSITRAANGDFYIVDDGALNDSPHYGSNDAKVIRISHVTGTQLLATSNALSLSCGGEALLQRPYAIAVEADGSVLVSDLIAPRVIRIDRGDSDCTGAQSTVAYTGVIEFASAMMVYPGAPIVRSATPRLTVSTTGVGAGFVDSSEAGAIDCGRAPQTDFNAAQPGAPNLPATTHVTCAHILAKGAVVTLTAHPAAGSAFAGFSGGDCSGNGLTCQVTMNGARNVRAHFNGRVLDIAGAGTGNGFVSTYPPGMDCGHHLDHQSLCELEFTDGQSVIVKADPYPASSTFAGFSGSGCSGTGDCTVTMSADRSVTASFGGPAATRTDLTVTATGGGRGFVHSAPGGINCSPLPGSDCMEGFGADAFSNGSQLVLTAYPQQGDAFVGFSGGGCSGTDPCRLTMDQARAVTATFDAAGTVQRSLSVITDGSGTGYISTAPAGIDCHIGAATPGTCQRAYDQGTRVVLDAHPLPGTFFSGFSGGGCSGPAPTCEVTLAQAQTVTANFRPAAIGFSPATRAVSEGGTLVVDLVLDAPTARRVTVHLSIGGSATGGADYTPPPTTVALAAGTLKRRLQIPIADDAAHEGSETIVLTIVDAVNAAVGATSAFTGTIRASD